MTRPNKNLGPNNLRAWRLHRGLTQAQVAERADTATSVICLLESGQRSLSLKWQRKLADVLEVTPGQLVDDAPGVTDGGLTSVWSRIPEERRALALGILELMATEPSCPTCGHPRPHQNSLHVSGSKKLAANSRMSSRINHS